MSHSKLQTASQVHQELTLEAAIHEVKHGMSLTGAVKVFGASRTTMTNRIQNPSPNPVGRKTKLPPIPRKTRNFDETALDISEMYDRVVARKGAKQLPSQFDGTEKESVTILPCGNAVGIQLKFMALYSGKVHVLSRLQDTHGPCYHVVNSSGYMGQVHFASYVKEEVFPARTELKTVIFVDGHFTHVNNLRLVRYCKKFFETTGKRVEIFCLPAGQTIHLQPFDVSAFGGVKKKWKMYLRDRRLVKGGIVTKDNLLSHVVKLWYRTEGCVDKYAFNVGECLKSGFAKTGMFPFSPDVIRKTVKAHHDPKAFTRGIRGRVEQDFGPLFPLLKSQFNLTTEKDLGDIKELIILKQKGITPGAVLANSVQKTLFGEAPVKQRREKNKHLCLESGALTTQPSFVAELEKGEAEKAAKKATTAVRRKTSTQEPAKGKSKATAVKKPRK
ncbi:hypothetical protein RvY_03568 [Ramazzottius varieornatus]|uniref:DDE-1 domain-containing protein n=1 Tax=Ramazzottius varieornatus TaxID=947166 RepID=A0A1D1UU76_RAMVA|nr:hypothetical protein RvY_03568 [Ramazzottius varieornatus]